MSESVAASGQLISAPAGLPSPPNDVELWSYLRAQNIWPQTAMLLSFILAAASLARFSLSSPWLYPFLVLLAVNVFSALLSAFSGFNRSSVSHSGHEDKVELWRDNSIGVAPSVDVYLPCCGEDLQVLRNTYHYTSLLKWDGPVSVWVLDDGDQLAVKELAESFGFNYIVRPDRGHLKKAGNLRHAFESTTGDYVVILDADFCPRADFLFHTIPYFDDPAVGIVQTPQFFSTTPSMGWLERTAGATQELFYRTIQPSRDRAGAPVCVGSCAVYRRRALDAAGGFAQIEHSEDVHTGISLLIAGFATRYVPILVSRGLCPAELGGFLNQQYRWCNGSMTLLTSGAAQSSRLTLWQKACFWAGFLYYISTALNVLTANLPIMIMAIFFPHEIKASYTLFFLPGMFVLLVVVPRMSIARWRFEVMRVQMAFSFSHAVALVHKLLGRTAGWIPTGAVGKKNQLTRTISRVGLITIAISTIVPTLGLAWDVWHYGPDNFWAAEAFLLAYCYLAVPLARDFFRVLHPRIAPNQDEGRPDLVGRPAGTDLVRSDPKGENTTPDRLSRPWALTITFVILLIGLGISGCFSDAFRVATHGGTPTATLDALVHGVSLSAHSVISTTSAQVAAISTYWLSRLGHAILWLAGSITVISSLVVGWRAGLQRRFGQVVGTALAGVAASFVVPFVASSGVAQGWHVLAVLVPAVGLTFLGVFFGTSGAPTGSARNSKPISIMNRIICSLLSAAALIPVLLVVWNRL